jgi:hypothetical protein
MNTTIHTLPPTSSFRDERVDSPITELALRVIVERPEWDFTVVGTATLIAPYLAITARHVLDHVIRTFGVKALSTNRAVIDGYEIALWQVLPGPSYRVFKVVTAWPTSTDVVVLHLRLDQATAPNETINWKSPCLRALPPPVNQSVVAFGYREGKINVTEQNGTHHIELNDRPTTSIGKVTRLYPSGRDRVMLPFPCFEIEARFEAGMSGGLVVDETGAVCGLICASLHTANLEESPVSYAVPLFPMLRTVISANRGGAYPRDVDYPIIDLAMDGLIAVTDLDALDPAEFRRKNG